MDYKEICLKVCDIAKETGMFIKNERTVFSNDAIEEKGLHNYVSYVDKTAEIKIIEALKLILPESGFIAEEGTEIYKGEIYNWVIDPLDGTTNFIHGLPPFAVSIALMEGEDIVVGVVYEVMLNECFYAWKEGNAWLNGKKIKVSNAPKLTNSLIATGFPYYDYKKMPAFMESLSYLFVNTHGVRRIGSAATDLAYVACGRFDAFYEYSLNPWDVAAGVLIVKEAGGKVSDFSKGENYIFGKEIIASNTNIYDEFSNVIAKYLNIK